MAGVKAPCGNSPMAKRRRNAMGMVHHTSPIHPGEDVMASSIGMFTATGSPILMGEARRMKDLLSRQSATLTLARSKSSLPLGREKHVPWEYTSRYRSCSAADLDTGAPIELPRPSTVAFHPLGMASDLKFDSKGTSYVLLMPGLNKKVERAVANLEKQRGPQDAEARWSMPRYEKAQDAAAIYQDMRVAFHEMREEQKERPPKMAIAKDSRLIPSQVRFQRSRTAPLPFFQQPPRTAPDSVALMKPQSLVPDLLQMLGGNSRPTTSGKGKSRPVTSG